MAVKHMFGIDREPNEPGDAPTQQKQADPSVGGAEGIDGLVSSFLAELADISTGMKEQPEVPGDPGAKHRAVTLPPLNLNEETGSKQDLDLQEIDKEIEQSLAVLENLQFAKTVQEAPAAKPILEPKPKEPPPQPEAAAPEPSFSAAARVTVSRRPTLPAKDSEELAWNKLDLFRNSYLPARRRRKIQITLAAIIVIGILAISAFFLLKAAGKLPGDFRDLPVSELSTPEPAFGSEAAARAGLSHGFSTAAAPQPGTQTGCV